MGTGTGQVAAAFYAMRVNSRTRRFMQMWTDSRVDFHLLSDEQSEAPNPAGFTENRHDQVWLSLLLKASAPGLMPACEACDGGKQGLMCRRPGTPWNGTWRRHRHYGIRGLRVCPSWE